MSKKDNKIKKKKMEKMSNGASVHSTVAFLASTICLILQNHPVVCLIIAIFALVIAFNLTSRFLNNEFKNMKFARALINDLAIGYGWLNVLFLFFSSIISALNMFENDSENVILKNGLIFVILFLDIAFSVISYRKCKKEYL